jgi:hypothetical protein
LTSVVDIEYDEFDRKLLKMIKGEPLSKDEKSEVMKELSRLKIDPKEIDEMLKEYTEESIVLLVKLIKICGI